MTTFFYVPINLQFFKGFILDLLIPFLSISPRTNLQENFFFLKFEEKNMKQIALIALISILSMTGRSQVTVDGKLDDWKLPLKYYDSESHLQYDIKNNDSILFVSVRIVEPRFQMKVAIAGMTLYVDTTGKKKQTMSFNYPITPSEKEPLKMDKIMGQPTPEKMKALVTEKLLPYKIEGFLFGNGDFTTASGQNLTVRYGYDSLNALNIEYRFPIKSFFSTGIKSGSEKKISLIFYVSNLPMPQMDGMPPDGPPMGGGGMPPGGPPMGDGNMPDFETIQQFFQSSTTVAKYNLQSSK